MEDTVAILNGTYDVHTNFKYSFQDPAYQNLQRDSESAKQLKKKPEMAEAQAKVPGQ